MRDRIDWLSTVLTSTAVALVTLGMMSPANQVSAGALVKPSCNGEGCGGNSRPPSCVGLIGECFNCSCSSTGAEDPAPPESLVCGCVP